MTDDQDKSETQPALSGEIADLMDIYFELEEPAERDALFDRIILYPNAEVTEFLRAMAHNDVDDYVQLSALTELARRGDTQALEVLRYEIKESDDEEHLEQVLHAFAQLGEAYYGDVLDFWNRTNGSTTLQVHALNVLEQMSSARLLTDLIRFVDALAHVDPIDEDLLEYAMQIFIRHNHTEGRTALQTLQKQLKERNSNPDAVELVALLQEGIDLLTPEV